MDIKSYMTWRNAGICAIILLAVGVIIFSIMYNKDVEHKFEDYKQIKSADYTIEENIEKLIIMNGVGEVDLIKSNGTKVEVNAYLQYVSDANLNHLKLEEMTSSYRNLPADEKDANAVNTAIVSNTLTDGTNYFSYLYDENMINDVRINYIIKVPSSVKEVYVYNPIGDVEVYNVDASLDLTTARGNIIVEDVKPNNFLLAQTDKGDIELNIDSMNTMYVGASATNGNITVNGVDEYKESNDSPKFVSMDNDIFKDKTYSKEESKFLSKHNYNNKQLEVSVKSKNGQTSILY